MVAQTRKTNTPRKLKFNDKLVGKGLATDALLKKLKALHHELAEMEQDNVELKSIEPVCKELISTSIMLHKDKGVKAYAACCLADILRLFAPDAPYTGPELRDIFQYFFRQLSIGLKGSDAPYYTEYFHLLESLSTVKSVVLVCDLPQAEELMLQIFRDFFGLVKHDQAKNIEMFMSDILVALIDECQMLPQEVLEAIMAQFMDKNANTNQAAYRLAVEVCNATADKLQRHVCQYFTDNIVQHAQAEDYEEVERCHILIKRLNVACPALLHNVVPQLEEELRVSEVQLRILATQTLGEMFAEKAGGDLEKKYPTTWVLWLKRHNDKNSQVRLAFVEGCKDLLLHHRADLREAVEDALRIKLLDPEEKVRAAVCKLYAQLDYETALHYASEEQLRAVGERTLDKKAIVRNEALISLGRLYSVAYPEIENNDGAAIKHFSWIPQQILVAINTIGAVMPIALQILAENILPVPSKGEDEVAWTDRLLTVMHHLDEKGVFVLLSICGLKAIRPNIFDHYLQACIENNGGVIDENEELVKRRLSAAIRMLVGTGTFSDPQKALEDLQTFAKMNEQRLYKLLKTCMDPLTDLKGLVKASGEFTRRIEQSHPSIVSTVMRYLRQCSLWIVNHSSVPTLVKRLQKGDHHGKGEGTSRLQVTANNAEKILVTISKRCPKLYKPHVSELAKAIADETNPRLVEVSLQALASVSHSEPEITPSDKRTVERLMRFVRSSNARQAKFAARVLAFTKDKEMLCAEVIESIVDELPKIDADALVGRMAVLVEMVRYASDAFETKSDAIIEFILKETLLQPTSEGSMEVDESAEEWAEEEDLPALARAKVLALKICRHRCLVYSKYETAVNIAAPVLKMLLTYLELQGLISEDCGEDPTVRSRLRLQAACSLAELATVPAYTESIHRNLAVIALTCQDPCYQVRKIFIDKLYSLIMSHRVHVMFNIIPFLTIHDPESEIKERAHAFVRVQFKRTSIDMKQRLAQWEMIFTRLLHLLAHHPDFAVDKENILNLAKYIQFYLQLIATADNISLLYHLAQRCKTIRDAESHTFSENLYAISELAQESIKTFAKQRQWSLTSYPEKVKLPGDIFRALPSDAARSTILKTQYLPDDIVAALSGEAALQIQKPKQERKRKASVSKPIGMTKRTRGPGKRRKHNSDDDGDDDADEIDSASDAEGGERAPSSAAGDDDDEVSGSESEGQHEEDLGRGARSRAKRKAQKKTKRKGRPKAPSSDD